MTKNNFNIIREYRNLKNDVFYPFDNKKCDDFPREKVEIEEKRTRLANILIELDDITIRELKQCKNNLLESIEKTLELTTNNKLGYPLSRNQGLIFSNYVYGKVLGILQSAIDSGIGFSFPQFYLDKNGDFDSTELINLLKEFHLELNNRSFSSFIELEAFYETYENKIKSLWEKENINHPQPRF